MSFRLLLFLKSFIVLLLLYTALLFDFLRYRTVVNKDEQKQHFGFIEHY